MAEIEAIENVNRLRLLVHSSGIPLPIAFHTKDKGAEFASKARVRHTVAVLYADKHAFSDGSIGVRVGIARNAKVGVFPYLRRCR